MTGIERMKVKGNGRYYQRHRTRSVTWWITYRHNGTEHRQSVARVLGFPPASVTEADAKHALDLKLREVYRHRFVAARHQGVTMGELLDNLLADRRRRGVAGLRLYEQTTARLKEEVGHFRAVEFTTTSFERLIDHWQDKKRHRPAYINDRLAFLKQAIRLGVEKDWLSHVPRVPKLKVRNARTAVVLPEAWPGIHETMVGVYADVAEFAWLSAWRKGEILSLTWDALDLRGRRLKIDWSKNNDGRQLPLDAPLWALLERRHRQRMLGVPLIFHLAGRPLCEKTVREHFQQAARKAGSDGLVFHDLRGSAATNMIDAGVPEFVVMKIGGWRSLVSLRRYHRQNPDRMKEGLEATRAYVRQRQATATPVVSRTTEAV